MPPPGIHYHRTYEISTTISFGWIHMIFTAASRSPRSISFRAVLSDSYCNSMMEIYYVCAGSYNFILGLVLIFSDLLIIS